MSKKSLVDYWKNSGIVKNERLLSAFKKVKRENFVLDKERAYDDAALPILCNQTISQPSTIMIMIDSIGLREDDNVLEIGTGSGYNLALICKLVNKTVYSLEIHKELIEFAENNLKKEKIKNYKIYHRNGFFGLKEKAPFDKIILTAAPNEIPIELIKQLKTDGIMIGPIGKEGSQKMIKITKGETKIIKEDLGDFAFVPMVDFA